MAELSRVAYVFPGQGAQSTGMGLDLYNSYPSAKEVFDKADASLGFSAEFAEGVGFACEARVICESGKQSPRSDGIIGFDGADDVLVILAMATTVESEDPSSDCKATLDNVPFDYHTLKTEHIRDHSQLFGKAFPGIDSFSFTIINMIYYADNRLLTSRSLDSWTG